MTYDEAMALVRQGKKVMRPHWHWCWVQLDRMHPVFVHEDRVDRPLAVSLALTRDDKTATDWIET